MSNPRRLVLDTDTYNEVDDQFALAHLLLSPDRVSIEAIYAAPFDNQRSSGPADGMERSYEEILRVLDLVGPRRRPPVFRGAAKFLPTVNTPVSSEVVEDLVERARTVEEGDRLHVVGIAAATNIASALLVAPEIADKIVVVWLGGHGLHWPHAREFNLQQDPYAARVLLAANVPLVLLPCWPVASHLISTVAELEEHLAPHSELGCYLTDIVRAYAGNPVAWSKVIWDMAASAWAVNPTWVPTDEVPAPILRKNLTWELQSCGRKIQVAREVDRDAIFADFFARAKAAKKRKKPSPVVV